MNLAVTIKTVYGLPKVYPVNEAAQALADIAGTKTLELRIELLGKEADAMRALAMMHHKWLRGLNAEMGTPKLRQTPTIDDVRMGGA